MSADAMKAAEAAFAALAAADAMGPSCLESRPVAGRSMTCIERGTEPRERCIPCRARLNLRHAADDVRAFANWMNALGAA